MKDLLWAEWLGFDSWQGQGISLLDHRVQIGSGAHAASSPIGTKGSFPGDKTPGD